MKLPGQTEVFIAQQIVNHDIVIQACLFPNMRLAINYINAMHESIDRMSYNLNNITYRIFSFYVVEE